MRMKRRTLLHVLISGFAALGARIGLRDQAGLPHGIDAGTLRALGDVVLPGELGPDGRARVIAGFLAWLDDYRAGADTDHGYGFPRLRRTPPSPAARYPRQLEALEAAARRRGTGFAESSPDVRHAIVETAIAAAKVERLPRHPDGGHVATDLMGYYFASADATDLCYRAHIGRDSCRSLAGSDERPAPLAGGGR